MLEIPEQYLSIFDKFNLSEKEQRRVASRALFDFYSDLFTQAGRKTLELQPKHINDSTLDQRWNVTKSRLRSVESIDVDEEYSRILNDLGDERNAIDHNPLHNPELEVLKKGRKIAPEWAVWFEQAVVTYDAEIGELSAKETLERIVRGTGKGIKSNPDEIEYDDLASRQKSLNHDADDLLERLNNSTSHEEGITTELVFILSDAKTLEQDKWALTNELNARLAEEERQSQAEYWRDYKNTYHCIIQGEHDPDWSYGIEIATVSAWRSDKYPTIDPYHPKTPDEIQDTLAELSQNEEVGLTLGRDKQGDWYVKEYYSEPTGY